MRTALVTVRSLYRLGSAQELRRGNVRFNLSLRARRQSTIAKLRIGSTDVFLSMDFHSKSNDNILRIGGSDSCDIQLVGEDLPTLLTIQVENIKGNYWLRVSPGSFNALVRVSQNGPAPAFKFDHNLRGTKVSRRLVCDARLRAFTGHGQETIDLELTLDQDVAWAREIIQQEYDEALAAQDKLLEFKGKPRHPRYPPAR